MLASFFKYVCRRKSGRLLRVCKDWQVDAEAVQKLSPLRLVEIREARESYLTVRGKRHTKVQDVYSPLAASIKYGSSTETKV